jgi:hypothetical protein
MLIDRSHRNWAVVILLTTLFCALIYVHQFHPAWVPFLPQPRSAQPHIKPGHTTLGLIYGSVTLAIFVFCCLLGWRRKFRAIGRMQTWLRAHIWLSVLTIPLVLMHAGFVMGGPMTTLLMVLYIIVMGSGFFGLALQQFLPRVMAGELPTEAIYEQIPYIRSQLLERAREICKILIKPPVPLNAVPSGKPGNPAMAAVLPSPIFPPQAMREINDTVIPYLQAANGKRLALGDRQASDIFFRRMRIETPFELETLIVELQGLCDERRQLDMQTTYQHWLHGWLIVHIPFSLALLMLTIWHAVIAQFFG